MENISYRIESGTGTDWKAIWAGTFIFYAIWAVFGALGLAIFASNASPNAKSPVMGQSIGMGIWAVILTIIAMYVAGRQTGRPAAVGSRHDALIHGLIMFGLSVVGLIVLVSLGGTAITQSNATTGAATTHSSYALTVISDLGWAGFVSLFLGWLAAVFGASAGAGRMVEAQRTPEVRQMRPAA